ncbi:MAG: hypothetical protein ABIQ86_09315 [Steroidobacteraceae bacterium]
MMLVLCLHASHAWAGPPYVTDDPVPTDTGRWEIFAYTDNNFDRHASATEAGFDINYGAAANLQLTATLAVQRETGTGVDPADIEMGMKYRLVDSQAHGFQLAVFPKLVLPTAPGPGKVAVQLPAWAQYDSGSWSLFGGGGVTLQRGSGKRDFWEAGMALVREVREGFSCGVELAHSSAEESGSHGATTAGVAFNLHVSGPLSLVGAAGPVFENHTDETSIRAYFGLLINF